MMRILFDQGVHEMRNIGNIAMTEVAIGRIKERWPDSKLEILTIAPHLAKIYFPEVRPIHPDGMPNRLQGLRRFDTILQNMPKDMLLFLFALREKIWHRWPAWNLGSASSEIHSGFQKDLEQQARMVVFDDGNHEETNIRRTNVEAIRGLDLYIATGGQYLADVVRDAGLKVLDRLEAAAKLGIPTVMVGQGIGPIDETELYNRAKAVLPLADLIFVRENLEAPRLLSAFGVKPERVILTGDDAIELAYKTRTNTFGNAIGVGMRVSHYSEVGENHIGKLLRVFQQASMKHRSPLVAVPISQTAHEKDEWFIRRLMVARAHTWNSELRFHTPLEIIQRVGQCRLVVTGAFHAAVFALAQGIPAVCVAKSDHYLNKFFGLADRFGGGCQVISLDDERLQEKLITAIDTAWCSAGENRPKLLRAAARQIQMGQAAYQRLYEMVEPKT